MNKKKLINKKSFLKNRYLFLVFIFTICITLAISTANIIFNAWQNYYSLNPQIIFTSFKEINKLNVLEANLLTYETFEDYSLLPLNQNSFTIIAKAKANYGLDLSNNVSVKTEDKTIIVELPKIELLSLEMNPQQIDIIMAKKGFFTSQNTFEQIKQTHLRDLYEKLNNEAKQKQYIQKSEENARSIITSMLRGMGFKQITISFKNKGM